MKFNDRQLMIFDEVFMVAIIAWFVYLMAEFFIPGLISNYYDLNIHFIILLILFIIRLFVKENR